jgi:hypothetical protein
VIGGRKAYIEHVDVTSCPPKRLHQLHLPCGAGGAWENLRIVKLPQCATLRRQKVEQFAVIDCSDVWRSHCCLLSAHVPPTLMVIPPRASLR